MSVTLDAVWHPTRQIEWWDQNCTGRSFEDWRSRLLSHLRSDVEKESKIVWNRRQVKCMAVKVHSRLSDCGSSSTAESEAWLRENLRRRGFFENVVHSGPGVAAEEPAVVALPPLQGPHV